MLRKTRLPQKRKTPRRNEGRVQHGRMRPKGGAAPTAEEKRHIKRVAAMPCLVAPLGVIEMCRCEGRVTVHHPTATIEGGRIARSHRRVTPLCEAHHLIQHGPRYSVEALGHRGFMLVYGIDLLAAAERLWNETVALNAATDAGSAAP